jgi:hypothetical protein
VVPAREAWWHRPGDSPGESIKKTMRLALPRTVTAHPEPTIPDLSTNHIPSIGITKTIHARSLGGSSCNLFIERLYKYLVDVVGAVRNTPRIVGPSSLRIKGFLVDLLSFLHKCRGFGISLDWNQNTVQRTQFREHCKGIENIVQRTQFREHCKGIENTVKRTL